MPSRKVRWLFTATSLAPILFVYAALFFFDGSSWFAFTKNKAWAGACLVGVSACLYLCHVILQFYANKVSSGPLKITSLKVATGSAITFVVVYLVPLVTFQVAEIQPEVIVVIFVLVAFLIYHSDAYLVNPLLTIPPFRYHFYEVTANDVTFILVSRREILNTRETLEVKQISRFMFLDVEG